jgi:ammonia channel protein AmtB
LLSLIVFLCVVCCLLCWWLFSFSFVCGDVDRSNSFVLYWLSFCFEGISMRHEQNGHGIGWGERVRDMGIFGCLPLTEL